MACELCKKDGGEILWQSTRLRVVLVSDNDYPGFCRVIWTHHVKEMSDLSLEDRHYMMSTVFAVESVLRHQLLPEKINLASLGNMTPHLHWHVIPRWTNDRHFPNPIWANPVRDFAPDKDMMARTKQFKETIGQTLTNLLGE